MKILFVITKSNWGGAQRYVFDLAVEAKKRGHEAVVLAGGNGELISRLKDAGIETRSLEGLGRDINVGSDFKSFLTLIRLIKEIRPDVLHVNSAKIGGLGTLAGRLTRVPRIIFTGHGWAFNEDRSSLSRIAIKFFSWITILLSHTTIAVSHMIQKQISAFPFTKRKIKVIHNSIQQEVLTEKDNARCLISPRALSKKIWIGTIGELHPIKGQEYLIRAMKEITDPEVCLVIIGAGEREAFLKNLIKEEGLTDRVFLAGRVSRAGTHAKAFDIFVLPSLSEGLAYVLLEAGLAGLPIIASQVGGIPEIIENGITGLLVPARDEHAIAEALHALLADESLRTSLGSAIQQKVLTEFSFEEMAQKTFETYSK